MVSGVPTDVFTLVEALLLHEGKLSLHIASNHSGWGPGPPPTWSTETSPRRRVPKFTRNSRLSAQTA